LVGLHTPRSDIDIVAYGSMNSNRTHSALRQMLEDGHELVKPYTKRDLKTLFEFRSRDTEIGFEDFLRTEPRKVMQGKFMGTDYFVRFVKGWDEIGERYGDVQYKNVGDARVEATVVDDSESTFTPCTYKVENVRTLEGSPVKGIEELTSFRGRFCEQARKGETVVAKGKVELVIDRKENDEHFRLLAGGKKSDYIVLKT
jgi:predicted nucleotidyltransferase